MNISEEIRGFVLNDIMRGEDPSQVDDEFDLIESGILDSLAMMQLVTFMEGRFAIQVNTNELIPENFGSVARLAAYVEAKSSP